MRWFCGIAQALCASALISICLIASRSPRMPSALDNPKSEGASAFMQSLNTSFSPRHLKAKPLIAACMTGLLRSNFPIVVKGYKELFDGVRKVGQLDVFVHLKETKMPKDALSDAMRALAELKPLAMLIHTIDATLSKDVMMKNFDPKIWRQQVQYQRCWSLIENSEVMLGKVYDFVIRTRADLLFSPAFKAQSWSLWRSSEFDRTAYGICKPRSAEHVKRIHGTPVHDVFFVARRPLAKIFMTTWLRRKNFTLGIVARHCWMFGDGRDYAECLSVTDLAFHGFRTRAIPQLNPLCVAQPWRVGSCTFSSVFWFSGEKHLGGCSLLGKS